MKEQATRKTKKLQFRLTWIVLAVVSVAFLLVFIIIIYNTYNNYRRQEINNQRYQLDKTVVQISSYQDTINNIAKQVIYDDVVQKGLTATVNSSGDYLYQKRNAQATLGNYIHIIESVQEIMIYTADGRTFSSRNIKDPFQPENNRWYEEFLASGKKTGFTGIHQSEPNQDGYTVDVISYVVSYYSVENTGQELGELMVSIEFDTIRQMAKQEDSLLKGYGLFDSEKNILIKEGDFSLSYEEIAAKNNNGIIHADNGDVFIVSAAMQDGWMLVTEISGYELMKKSVSVCLYLFLVFILVVLILLVTLRRLIRSIVYPINQLGEAAEEVGKGNFAVSVNIQTNDELEVLADVFNKMVVDIQVFMNQSVEHEKIRQRMQIENLMLQINPHFIYNTINSIVYMAKMSGNRQIADFANAFISLLQSTLDVRDSIYNTVAGELTTVENYLCLQKYRYDDKFTYEIDCDEELKECEILNVMLQPAVENAIFHGIAPKEENGRLKISIRREGDSLHVMVADDGIGMTVETLNELTKPDHNPNGGVRKIGVANVRDRIREIFGQPYGLTIESELGIGTRVIMIVPYMKQKNALKGTGENYE